MFSGSLSPLAIKPCFSHLSVEAKKCGEIKAYLEEGRKVPYISQQVGLSERQVRHRIYKEKVFHSMEHRKSSGRPRKTTAGDDREIVLTAKRDPFVTPAELKSSLTPINLSESTILRRLHECPDLEFARSSKKPKLSHKHIVSRKKWGRDHRNWSPEDWNRVLWSDECTFYLHSQHQHGVWRSPKHKYDQKYVTPTCKSRRKVNIWGAMSGTELLPLVRIEGNLNAKKSMGLLEENMVPTYEMSNYSTFMQDNAPSHTAKLTQRFLLQNHVDCMDWPAYSPDLNPMENLWHTMKLHLGYYVHETEEELFHNIQHV
jgi:hypothetical protein